MPVADEIGITKPLTGWMLNSAMRLSSEWTRQWGALEVSVNIPTRIMEQPDFVDLVLSSEGLWKQDDVTLCLEVLESSFIDDVEACFFKLKELQQKGIHIAIDDFGTGYSSLSYFRDIPANELKIDRSFVSGLLSDKVNANIVALIIDMAHRFNLTVVAEGAEDMETVAALKNLGCDKVQGFVYSTPLPSGEFADWLRNFKPVRKP